jgi:hypothetical protein
MRNWAIHSPDKTAAALYERGGGPEQYHQIPESYMEHVSPWDELTLANIFDERAGA